MRLSNFIGGSYETRAVPMDSERTINFYVERMESPGTTSQAALYPTPGMTELDDGVIGHGRAHAEFDGLEYAVIGGTFYTVNQSGTLASVGTVALDSNPATLSYNGDGGGEILVTSGGSAYIYNISAGTLSSQAGSWASATFGDMLDGYFLILDDTTSTLWVSDLLDGTTWSATQFLQRSEAPDSWVAMKVHNNLIYLLGRKTSTVLYDAGTSPFPFEVHPSGRLHFGCAAAFSIAVGQGAVSWLGAYQEGAGGIFRATGFSPERISTYPLQVKLEGLAKISDATGEVVEDQGHTFYLLTVPSAKMTYAYDEQGGWAERSTWNSSTGEWGVWRPTWHARAYGEARWLDSGSGKIYKADHAVYTDAGGGVIRRLRRTPTLMYENERLFYGALELDMDTGRGAVTGQGADPQVMMRYSNDGGRNWSNELWRSGGKIGEYLTRVRWNRLGSARKRTYEFVVTDPISWKFLDCYLEMDQPPAQFTQAAQWQQ